MSNDVLPETQDQLADDLLYGAEEIAWHLFKGRKTRNTIYYLARRTNFPSFKIGATICARKSKIEQWIATQEGRRWVPPPPPPPTPPPVPPPPLESSEDKGEVRP